MGEAVTERERFERDLEIRRSELQIQKDELSIRRKEAAKSTFRSPLLVAAAAAAIGAFGNILVEREKNANEIALERFKQERELISDFVIVEATDPDRARETFQANIRFLVDAGLVTDQTLVGRLNDYAQSLSNEPTKLAPQKSVLSVPAARFDSESAQRIIDALNRDVPREFPQILPRDDLLLPQGDLRLRNPDDPEP